ncbi:PPE family protein [Mycobacterium rhizamassiliense]|jgi:PPE-repeat protein|uniref:PPE family protein n=1 Tax=Mycobacterium rhizamassiliense TaxID=1841860 RepID=A0A2U3NZ32_9MYCO|nr:PPE family protein [Mycobacterium rhizamassiliense]SPM36746.1 PPE family protein [Mycobacterium rhizamassiliense]
MDFGALPPEINSGRIYAGPGSGPILAAGEAWDGVASELNTAAAGYASVVSELTGAPWVGPAATSMLSAVTPYVVWLNAVGGQAEETAIQARAAAAAFETAFAMSVPPPVIAANRVLLANLIATNFFGQNTPAIAVTEAQYAEMWAQDAVAMYTYAASSATASVLPPIEQPPNTTTPDAENDQALAVSKAVAEPAGNSAKTASNAAVQLTTSPTVTTQATQAAATTTTPGPLDWLWNSIEDFFKYGLPTPTNNWTGGLTAQNFYTPLFKSLTGLPYFGVGMGSFGYSIQQQTTFGLGTTAGAAGAWFPTPQFAGLFLGASHGGGAAAASAHLASAVKVGGLSVPSSWGINPAEALENSAIKATTVNYLASEAAPSNGILQGMPMTGGARRGAAGFTHKYGFRQSVLTRPPSAG